MPSPDPATSEGRTQLELRYQKAQQYLQKLQNAAAKCYAVNPNNLPEGLYNDLQAAHSRIAVLRTEIQARQRAGTIPTHRNTNQQMHKKEEGRWE